MTHYTLMLNRPEGALRERFPKVKLTQVYNTPQALVWDGPANKRDIKRLYDALAPYCSGISLTRGRRKSVSVSFQGSFN
jgi:hypothetical protein